MQPCSLEKKTINRRVCETGLMNFIGKIGIPEQTLIPLAIGIYLNFFSDQDTPGNMPLV